MSLLNAALDLAAAGWPVFPLRGKVPLIRGGSGHLDGTTDLDQVRAWWQRWPDAGIGARVPESLFVVDVDPRSGGDVTLAALEAYHGPLPTTLKAYSGRGDGGHHVYWRHPGGTLTGARLGQGLDLKVGGRGYVVVPPSLHPDTGQAYRWDDTSEPVAAAPTWLVTLLRPDVPRPRPAALVTAGKGYGAAAVADEAARVAAAPEGTRNHTLNVAAFRLGQLVAAGTADETDARAALTAAAASCGLDEREAHQTITSGLSAGHEHPRGPK